MTNAVSSGAGDDETSDLCRPFLLGLPIDGASVTVMVASGAQTALSSTDATAARIDELQFELGEGPQWLAAQSGEIVLIPDVATADHAEWPVFGEAVRHLPVGAIFSIPMRMGAVTVGAATLYRATAGELSRTLQASALAIASALAPLAVQRAMHSANEDESTESSTTPAMRREVHQATGMILAQLDTTATVAYSRLQAYAFVEGRTVQDVAHDVVIREIVFVDDASL